MHSILHEYNALKKIWIDCFKIQADNMQPIHIGQFVAQWSFNHNSF